MKRILLALFCCLPLLSFAESSLKQEKKILSFVEETAGLESNESPYSGKSLTTQNVRIDTTPEGWVFHVADHIDGSRVVTAMNGDLEGYQIIGYNGQIVTNSRNYEVHKGYFIHFYTGGKVTSYPKKQIAKFY